MSQYMLVLCVLLAVAFATPTIVSECGRLDKSFSTYKLMSDVLVRDNTNICFDITGKGITLDGNGFEVRSASGAVIPATGVQLSGESATVTNLHITNIRTGINAKAKFSNVYGNVITRGTNGIDVSGTNNRITNNKIHTFQTTDESTSGIYVYFPALFPVDSYVNITNNVIFDIQGDSFAQGISVYYANSVYIGQNRIYNIQGGLMSQPIAVIQSEVDTFDNTFTPLPSDGLFNLVSLLLTASALLISFFYFRTSSSLPRPVAMQTDAEKEAAKKKEEKAMYEGKNAEDDDEEYEEADGADVVKRKEKEPRKILRFSLSSSISLLSSPIM